jgi:hypothetical protein
LGQAYFVDMVSGIWKVNAHGELTHIPGPAFHWLALDGDDRFATGRLPSGSTGDITRLGRNPTILLASDTPIAIGPDGNLYYPTHQVGSPLQILKLLPSGQQTILATLPTTDPGKPLRDLNGLAAGTDGSLYYTEDDAIRRVHPDGRVTTVTEHVAQPGCASPLLRGLVVDAGDTIYVAATGCGTVLKVSPEGRIRPLPRARTAWAPTGVALFGHDVYVLEFEHPTSDDRRAMVPRVRMVTPDGTSRIVAAITRQ